MLTQGARAKLLGDTPGVPVQLMLPAQDVVLLAYISEEFARSLSPSNGEAEELQKSASAISTVLLNCLMARDGI